jgi:hypothetical protein
VLPSVPTNVSATDGAYSDRVNVNFNRPWGTEYYEVWRNTSNNSATATKLGTDSSVPYVDWSTVAGTFYWYWVKACRNGNGCGCSGFSSPDRGYSGTIPGIETISSPSAPTGPGSGVPGVAYSYSTSGSTSSLGHAVQYQFDWYGDGSELSDWGPAARSMTWTVAGWKNVKARARCATDIYVISEWSSGLSVSISSPVIYVRQGGLCGGKDPCYPSIQNGISSAQSLTIMEISQETYDENVILNNPKVLTLQGGWDANFTSNASYTIINGSLTISGGTMIVENIILQ